MDNTKSEYTQEDISLLQKSKPSIQTVEGASLFENHDKEKIKEALYQIAVPLVEIAFSRNNFNRLFPRSRIETPVETVKIGAHQFEKLEKKDRTKFLSAAYETLSSPHIVIREDKTNVFGERESSHLYVRSYIINEKRKAVQTVVVGIEDFNVAISTHPRDINNIINKIKTPDQLLFVATSVGRIIRQHTQEGQSVADSNRALSFGTLTEPPNKLYNEKKALSIKDLIESQKIIPVQGTTNNAHQAGKGVYMSNEFAELEDQYLERMANGGASDRALEEGYLEQETQKDTRNLYTQGGDVKEGQKKPYYQKQVENLLDAVKSGKTPFLPQEPILGEDGKMISSGNYSQDGDKLVINPRPAVRMLSGNILTGVNQITAQIELDKMQRKSQTVLTWEQAKQEGAFIKKGAQSFVLTGYDKDAGEGQSKSKVYHVFAAGDVSNSKTIQGALNKNANANAPKPWTKEVLSCHDSTPEKFLGTYMAASATGAKFETNMETVQQFKQQFTQMMEKSIAEKQHTAIFEVARNAQKYASAIRENSYKQWEKANNKEKEAHTRNLQQRAKGMEMGL